MNTYNKTALNKGRYLQRIHLVRNQLNSISTNFKTKNINNYLQEERQKSKWDKTHLIDFLNGGAEKTKRRKYLESLFCKPSKVLSNKQSEYSESQHLSEGVKDFLEFQDELNKLNPTLEDLCLVSEMSTSSDTFNNSYNAFIRVLKYKASVKQQKFWIPKATNFEIIGSYVMNELGHDKFNTTGLQTTATYDKKLKHFILNTPSIESIKWWSNWLGKVSTHVVFHANLIIDGKVLGLITLLVQIRDENHKVLPGFKVGNVGRKIGLESQEMGYLIFENAVVPKDSLLSKHHQISDDGELTQTPIDMKEVCEDEIDFATLMVHSASGRLSKAATIAIRYTCVQKRGFVECKGFFAPEKPIIDYRIQRRSLLKQLAHAFALKFLGNWMIEQISILKNSMKEGKDPHMLEELWYTFNTMKGMATIMSTNSLEDLRKCCGSNAYLINSGIAKIAQESLAWPEHDYNIMGTEGISFGAWTLKAIKSLLNGGPKFKGHLEYLNAIGEPKFDIEKYRPKIATTIEQFQDLDHILTCYKFNSLDYNYFFNFRFHKFIKDNNKTFEQAVVDRSPNILRNIFIHCNYLIMKNYIDKINEMKDPAIKKVLHKLACIYANTHFIDNNWGPIFDNKEFQYMDGAINSYLDEIRPDVVTIVDSFDYPDNCLNFTIGIYDGNIYEALLEGANNSTLNKNEPFLGYESLKPYLNKTLLKSKN